MDIGLLSATIGVRLGQLAFGGGLLWSTLLLAWSNRCEDDAGAAAVDEAYLDVSVAMSVGLTVLVFATIASHYLVNGRFTLPLETPAQVLTAIQYGLFLPLWLHWGYVEIVIMQRFRAEMPRRGEPLTESYRRTRARVRTAHGTQFALFLLLVAVETGVVVLRWGGG